MTHRLALATAYIATATAVAATPSHADIVTPDLPPDDLGGLALILGGCVPLLVLAFFALRQWRRGGSLRGHIHLGIAILLLGPGFAGMVLFYGYMLFQPANDADTHGWHRTGPQQTASE